jgi:hypothetical protein
VLALIARRRRQRPRTLAEEEEAREHLEARYLVGRPVMLAETKSRLGSVRGADRPPVVELEEVVPLSGDEKKQASKLDLASLDPRAADRAPHIADDARSRPMSVLARTRGR